MAHLHSQTSPVAVPGFQYSPLLSSKSIRLLEINTDEGCLDHGDIAYEGFLVNDIIDCNLISVDLKDSIKYNALSYTWGHPLTVYTSKGDAHKAVETYKEQVPIICNGKKFMVGINLYDALVQLRNARRTNGPLLNQFYSDLPEEQTVGRYIWIDAICIDQTNTAEKNSQVQRMDEIYKGAFAVLFWLGPHDDFSRTAGGVIHLLANLPIAAARSFTLLPTLESARQDGSELASLRPEHWLAVFAFFERQWFQRAWIVQEIALAKLGIVMCGTMFLPWGALSRAAGMLRECRCYPILWQQGIIRSTELMSVATGMYRIEGKDSHARIGYQNPIITVFLISDVRGGLGHDDPTESLVESPELVQPLRILTRFRSSECGDPRDKVFAFLSLWPHRHENGSSYVLDFVDYALPVTQVYMKVAWALIESSRNLRVLSHVGNHQTTAQYDLPSWVPNWDRGEMVRSFEAQIHDADGKPFYHACGESEWDPNLSQERNQLLHVQGLQVGSIVNTGTFKPSRFEDIVPVLNDIPNIYTTFAFSDISEDDSILGNIQDMPDELGESLSSMTISKPLHAKDINATSQPSRSPSTDTNKSNNKTKPKQVIDIVLQTRFEALWRCLIVDAWNLQHPAPQDAGSAFVHSFIAGMMTLLERARRLGETKLGMMHEQGVEGLLVDEMTSVLEGTASEEGLDQVWRSCMCCLLALRSDEETSIGQFLDTNSPTSDEHVPLTYFPTIESSEDVLSFDLDEELARQWDGQSWKRPLFSTDTHKLGLGPEGIQGGDEVWILKGAEYPFILRPLASGNYRLVGEAYVHGIMHGEALIFNSGIPFREIVIE